jgi:hypothetical protein
MHAAIPLKTNAAQNSRRKSFSHNISFGCFFVPDSPRLAGVLGFGTFFNTSIVYRQHKKIYFIKSVPAPRGTDGEFSQNKVQPLAARPIHTGIDCRHRDYFDPVTAYRREWRARNAGRRCPEYLKFFQRNCCRHSSDLIKWRTWAEPTTNPG